MPSEIVLPDIPRLYTAVSEWLACMLFILNAPKRFSRIQSAVLYAASLTVFIVFHIIAGVLPLGFWMPCMIIAVLLMCLAIWLTTKNNVKMSCYLGVQAFIVAEFISAVEWWLYYFFSTNFPSVSSNAGSVLFAVGIYAVFFTGMFFIERHFSRRNLSKISTKDLITTVIIVVTAFLVSNISFMHWNTPLSGKYTLEIFYIRTLVDLCGLLVLYSNREMKIAVSAEAELTQIRLLLDRQYEQYCLTKNAIDSVNRRYHDLKHQVALIRGQGTEAAERLVDEIENETKLYEVVYKTGNDILDTILMSKSVLCVRQGITFTCVADGSALNFIGDADICSLFGNALDNAIESFEGNDDGEAKLIKLAVYKNNGLLIIRCENTFRGELKTFNGELLTTKRNKTNHGYGVKSIKTVAAKYGGTVTYAATDGTFTLCVVI
ncbi:MAG: ATP-binding protein, partial [Clostridia bacterium]|nr:ATP-binding protein [Clostridia bacterium]